MKKIDDEENAAWPNLKAMLALVPIDPGTFFIAVCRDNTGSTTVDFPSEALLVIAFSYLPAPRAFKSNFGSLHPKILHQINHGNFLR